MMCSGSHQILQNSLSRWSNIATAVSLIQEKNPTNPKPTNQKQTKKNHLPTNKPHHEGKKRLCLSKDQAVSDTNTML